MVVGIVFSIKQDSLARITLGVHFICVSDYGGHWIHVSDYVFLVGVDFHPSPLFGVDQDVKDVLVPIHSFIDDVALFEDISVTNTDLAGGPPRVSFFVESYRVSFGFPLEYLPICDRLCQVNKPNVHSAPFLCGESYLGLFLSHCRPCCCQHPEGQQHSEQLSHVHLLLYSYDIFFYKKVKFLLKISFFIIC